MPWPFPVGMGPRFIYVILPNGAAGGQIDSQVLRIVREFHDDRKPIAAICIAPAIMALAFGEQGVNVTIGEDQGTASEVEKTGAKHTNCAVEKFVVDSANKVITTPAYMYGTAKPHQIFEGVSGAIAALMKMA